MPQALRQSAYDASPNRLQQTANREDVCIRIRELGVIPALRGASAENAAFAAQSLAQAGIPILEIAVNRPEGMEAISRIVEQAPEVMVGAGSITDMAMARQCVDAGARFLTSDAMVPDLIEFAARQGIAVLPGAFTPTEIVVAWNAGADFVKVVPCNAAGGSSYIRSLRAALPDVPLIAAGGVTQLTAFDLVAAGATALGVGAELISREALRLRQSGRIQELTRRFLAFVDSGRIEAAGRSDFSPAST